MFFSKLRKDIAAAQKNDPAARNKFEILLTYSGVHALSWHRWANFLYRIHLKLLARMTSQFAKFLTGIEIHPAAKIAPGVFIDHGMGVVIGETAEIGDNCTLYQCVTLGGTGKDHGKRHPTLGNNVMVGSGAKILGPFRVGDNARVAAGAVVLNEVPANSTAVGVPARIVRINGQKPASLDQIHVGDPVAAELTRLSAGYERLAGRLEELDPRGATVSRAGTEKMKYSAN